MAKEFELLMTRLKDPESLLTPEEKNKLRSLSSNAESSIKASLVNLLMNQFTKVSVYDKAMAEVIKLLIDRSQTMEDDDLLTFLSVLTKTSSVESKNIMDLFKKNDNDLKHFLNEIKKLQRSSSGIDDVDEIIDSNDEEKKTLSRMDPEKKEKLIQLINKMKK